MYMFCSVWSTGNHSDAHSVYRKSLLRWYGKLTMFNRSQVSNTSGGLFEVLRYYVLWSLVGLLAVMLHFNRLCRVTCTVIDARVWVVSYFIMFLLCHLCMLPVGGYTCLLSGVSYLHKVQHQLALVQIMSFPGHRLQSTRRYCRLHSTSVCPLLQLHCVAQWRSQKGDLGGSNPLHWKRGARSTA